MGDRLRLRAAVLVAGERVDDVCRLGVHVCVEHLPAAVGGLADDELVPVAVGVVVTPDRWLSHRSSLRLSSSLRVRLRSAASSNRAATASSAPACSANSLGNGPGSAMNV